MIHNMELEAAIWPEIEKAISARELRTFRTKREAITAGRSFSHPYALRFNRRFERVWICAKTDFQPDTVGDLVFDVVRAPLLRWERNDGYESCPVVKFRRLRPVSVTTIGR